MRYTVSRTHELNESGAPGMFEAQAQEFDSAHGRVVGRLTITKRISLRVQAVNQASRTLALRDANDAIVTVAIHDDDHSFDRVAAGDILIRGRAR